MLTDKKQSVSGETSAPSGNGSKQVPKDVARETFLTRVKDIPGVLDAQIAGPGVWVLADSEARWRVFELEAELMDQFPDSDLQVRVRRAQ